MTTNFAAVNDAPVVASALVNQAVNEDSALTYAFASGSFTDTEGDTLTYTAALSNGNALSTLSDSWLTFTAGSRTFSGTPLNGGVGTITIRVTATDDGAGTLSVTDDFDIVISNTNDAPTTSGGSATPNEDATHTFTTTASDWGYADVDSGDALVTVDITTLPATGTLRYSSADVTQGQDIAVGSLGGLTYVPVGDANGAVTFTFNVYDGDAWAATAGIFTLTYAAVDDDPVAADSDNTGAITEDASTTTASDTLVGTDADSGDTLTWSCTSCTDAGDTQTLTGTYGSWVLTEATGAWTYTISNADTDTDALDPEDTPTDTLTAVLSDGGGTTDSVTVTVTITGANDAPTSSTPSTQAGAEDTTFTGYAVADFPYTDVDGGDTALISITITVVESSGDLEKSLDGSTYTDVAANDVILNDDIQHLRLDHVHLHRAGRRHLHQRLRHNHQFRGRQRRTGEHRQRRRLR